MFKIRFDSQEMAPCGPRRLELPPGLSLADAEKMISDFKKAHFDHAGRPNLMPAAQWLGLPFPLLRLLCHKEAMYGIPTIELMEDIRTLLSPYDERRPFGRISRIVDTVIEVGAGRGFFHTHGFLMTDSRIQENSEVILQLRMMHAAAYQLSAGCGKVHCETGSGEAPTQGCVRLVAHGCVPGQRLWPGRDVGHYPQGRTVRALRKSQSGTACESSRSETTVGDDSKKERSLSVAVLPLRSQCPHALG